MASHEGFEPGDPTHTDLIMEELDEPQFMSFLEGLVHESDEARAQQQEQSFAAKLQPVSISHAPPVSMAPQSNLPQPFHSAPIVIPLPAPGDLPAAPAAVPPSIPLPQSVAAPLEFTAAPQVPMSKEELQKEKIRAKNRRNQARYRERCKKERKELEDKIKSTRYNLKQATEKCRTFRCERQALLHRITIASADALASAPVATTDGGGDEELEQPIHVFVPPTHPEAHVPAGIASVQADQPSDGSVDFVTQLARLRDGKPVQLYGPTGPSEGTRGMHRNRENTHHSEHMNPNPHIVDPSTHVFPLVIPPKSCRQDSTSHIVMSSLVPTRAGRRRFVDEYEEIPRTIESFLHMAPISFTQIAPFLPPSSLWYTSHHNAVSAAISMYQTSVCDEISRSRQDICWFNLHPFSLAPGLQISHSVGAFSPECCLSLSLAFPCISAESLFLVLEHELLEASSNPSYVPPPHPALDALSGDAEVCNLGLNMPFGGSTFFSDAPKPPDPKEMDRFSVRCGVNGVFPLKDAVEQVIRPTFRKYRARLPHKLWSATCKRSMIVLHTALEAMLQRGPQQAESDTLDPTTDSQHNSNAPATTTPEGSPPTAAATTEFQEFREIPQTCDLGVRYAELTAEHSGSDEPYDGGRAAEHARHSAQSGGLRDAWARMGTGAAASANNAQPGAPGSRPALSWDVLDAGMTCLMQYMLCVLHEVLHEKPAEEERQTRSVDEINGRMFELMATAGISCRLLHEAAPVAMRRMLIGKRYAGDDLIHLERLQMKVFGYLQLTSDQKAELAEKWRTWHRRRHALDRQLTAAASAMARTLPSPEDLPHLLPLLQACLPTAALMGGSGGAPCRSGSSSEPAVSCGTAVGPTASLGDDDAAPQDAPPAYTSSHLRLATSLPYPPGSASAEASSLEASGDRGKHVKCGSGVGGTPPEGGIPGPSSLGLASDETASDPDREGSLFGRSSQSQGFGLPTLEFHDKPSMVVDPRLPLRHVCGANGAAANVMQIIDASERGGTQLSGEAMLQGTSVEGLAENAVPATLETVPFCHVTTGAFEHLGPTAMHDSGDGAPQDLVATGGGQKQHAQEVIDSQRFWSGFAEGKLPRLLGINCEVTTESEDALEALVDVHRSDMMMYHEFVSLTAMPSWVLTEVQHARLMASHTELGIPMVDVLRIFQAAAHEQRWEALIAPLSTS